MARGRKPGQIELSIDEIQIILDMTQSKDPVYTRGEIAKKIGRSKRTIWRYQKYYSLI